MAMYVTVSDLLINGGEGCTLLYKQPEADHIVITEDDNGAAHLGDVLIQYGGKTVLYRAMRTSMIYKQQHLSIGDLNDVLRTLCRDRLNCFRCRHFDYGHCWENGHTWKNFRAGECPYREEEV